MSFTPPNTFSDGTALTSADLEGNADALRVYLHRGVVSGDFEATPWIETRHIQPPMFEPFSGVQHGVSGHQGGQWAGGLGIRLQFATKYLSGNGRQDSVGFHAFPQTAVTLAFRQRAKVLFHYWWELENGKDQSSASYQIAEAQRRVYVTPYAGTGFSSANAYASREWCQETRNNVYGIGTGYPIGLERPMVLAGGYAAKQGTFGRLIPSARTFSFGLAIHSMSDRCGIVNWGIAVETWYM